MKIPYGFENNIITIYGDEGRLWLDALPNITSQLQEEWKLSKLVPLKGMNYHYMMSGVGHGQPIILKLGIDRKNMKREANALKIFENNGGIKLLDEQEGALLLERALPGYPLKELFGIDDCEAIDVVCSVMNKIHATPLPPEGTLTTLKERLSVLDMQWHIPLHILKKARFLRDKLLDTCTAPVMLHGDLHHENILETQNHDGGWVAIDPQGLIGEACYDIPAFIRNPKPDLMEHSDVIPILEQRIKRFAENMEIDEHRIVAWCYVQAVLAWIWSLEDFMDPTYYQRMLPLFNDML